DVRGRGACGQRQVGEEEDEHGPAQPDEEPAAEREAGREDLREADFLEPEPVGVERHRLAPSRQDQQGEEKPEADAGPPRVPDRLLAATSHAPPYGSAAARPAAQKGPAARRRQRPPPKKRSRWAL